MDSYLEVIRNAVFFFPFIAFFFTIPYMLHQYHKYGSIYYVRVFIIYSFILYLITAYFLVILPLPTLEEVAQLTTPRVQLIPFSFVSDFLRETSFRIQDVSTYVKAFLEPCVYVVIYNVLLTIPFGIYIRYYFGCSRKKTVFLTFLLSLFFELTQLSGLYFIYPRGYRLFDVDDLFLNTVGGLIGVYLADLLAHVLPSREKIDEEAYHLGKKVSFLKRITCFWLDFFLFAFLYLLLDFFLSYSHTFFCLFILHYFLIPCFTNGSTLAQKFLNLKLTSTVSEKLRIWQILLHQGLFYFVYLFLPYFALSFGGVLLDELHLSSTFLFSFYLLGFFGYLFVCFVSLVLVLCKRKLFYEIISRTRLSSTILEEEEIVS